MTFEEADRLLREGNRDLRLAVQAYDAARADVLSADHAPNPVASYGATSINPRSVGSGNLWGKRVDSVFRVDQTVERGGKRELRRDVAGYVADAARLDTQAALLNARLALVDAYYDLHLADRRLAILDDIAALEARTVDAGERRLAAGDISGNDLTRLRVEAVRSVNDARAARADRDKAAVMLTTLLALPAGTMPGGTDVPPPQTGMPPALDYTAVAASRADVAAARLRVSAASRARDLALAQRKSDITVGVQYENSPPDGRNLWGFGVSIPLQTRYAYEGEIRRADADYVAAELTLEKTEAQAQSELRRFWSDLASARERWLRSRDALRELAQKAADGAELAYARGALGLIDLLDARRALRAARLELAATEAEYLKAQRAWEMETTGGTARQDVVAGAEKAR